MLLRKVFFPFREMVFHCNDLIMFWCNIDLLLYKSDQILYRHKNRKEHREGKRKVFIEFLSVNTFPSKHEKPAPSIQLPSILMILLYPLHYESRQGQAEGEVFPKMQFLVNAVFSCMLEKITVHCFSLDSLYCKVCQVGLMFSPSLSI